MDGWMIRTARPRVGGGRRSRRDAIAIGRAREGVVTVRTSKTRQMNYVSSSVRSVEDGRGGVRAVGVRTRRWMMRSVYPSERSVEPAGRARGRGRDARRRRRDGARGGWTSMDAGGEGGLNECASDAMTDDDDDDDVWFPRAQSYGDRTRASRNAGSHVLHL